MFSPWRVQIAPRLEQVIFVLGRFRSSVAPIGSEAIKKSGSNANFQFICLNSYIYRSRYWSTLYNQFSSFLWSRAPTKHGGIVAVNCGSMFVRQPINESRLFINLLYLLPLVSLELQPVYIGRCTQSRNVILRNLWSRWRKIVFQLAHGCHVWV